MDNIDNDYVLLSKKNIFFPQLINLKIVNIFMCDFYDFEEYKDYVSEVGGSRYSLNDYFKFAEALYLFQFDNGYEIAFAHDEELNSITISFQKSADKISDIYLLNDLEIKSVVSIKDVYEQSYLDKILNQPIKSIEILTLKEITGNKSGRPNENGLKFIFTTNETLTISWELINDNPTFSLLDNNDTSLNQTIVKFKI